jgi:hypothetical protein
VRARACYANVCARTRTRVRVCMQPCMQMSSTILPQVMAACAWKEHEASSFMSMKLHELHKPILPPLPTIFLYITYIYISTRRLSVRGGVWAYEAH